MVPFSGERTTSGAVILNFSVFVTLGNYLEQQHSPRQGNLYRFSVAINR